MNDNIFYIVKYNDNNLEKDIYVFFVVGINMKLFYSIFCEDGGVFLIKEWNNG